MFFQVCFKLFPGAGDCRSKSVPTSRRTNSAAGAFAPIYDIYGMTTYDNYSIIVNNCQIVSTHALL